MNKTPEISIIMPAIRTDNWDAVYDSILTSTKRTFELIIVGPYPLTKKLQDKNNVKYAKDFGSPVRASQIAASLAEGKYFVHTADDALFLPDALDKNIDLLLGMGEDVKNIVVAKYFEGQNGTTKPLHPDSYFTLGGSTWTKTKYIPGSWWLFNVAIMYREYFEKLGGWDCSFEGTFYSHCDLAIRAQHDGAIVKMSVHPLLDCDHGQSDHQPIEHAQTLLDKPLYFSKYDSYNNIQVHSLIDNWKESPAVWERFK